MTGLSASKEFYKVMVAIDGSQHSKHAAEYAIFIAKKHDSELIVIHVLQFNSTVLSLAFTTHGKYEAGSKKKFREDKAACN